MQLVLSLFPGLGLLDMAFEQEGFCVVRGPDCLWGGDVRRFHPPAGKFDGVIGGPPCQSFSSLVHLVRANGHEPRFGNLIPEFERCVVEAQPAWFLMENVPQAPEPGPAGYGVKSFLLDNSMLNDGTGFGLEQRRVRRFSFGMLDRAEPPNLLRWIDLAVFLLPDASDPAVISGTGFPHGNGKDGKPVRVGSSPSQPVDNSQEAKRRFPAITSTDGGEQPSEKRSRTRDECVNGSHGVPPSVRDKAARVPPSLAGHEQVEGLNERRRQKAVSSSSGGNGGGKEGRLTPGAGNAGKGRYRLTDACRLQGLPEDFLADAPFTAEGKLKAVANGVPLPMGRAIARAVKEAISDRIGISSSLDRVTMS